MESLAELKNYFESKKGIGVLSTADRDGAVDAALYSRPHFMEDGTLALIMRDRLSHKNIQSNPHAAYLFVEEGEGYQGKRLFLKMTGEEKDSPRIEKLKRRKKYDEVKESRYLVYFQLEKVLPLVGAGEDTPET
jgi:hypothetical protein